jgi:hypothetical protein
VKTIKILLVVLIAGGLGFAAAMLWINHRQTGSPESGNQPTVAQTETTGETAAPSKAVSRLAAAPTEPVPVPRARSPEDILNELAGIQVTPGPAQGRVQYRIMSLLEQLAQCGSAALPAIRQFLASNRDVAYDPSRTAGGNRQRNNNPSLLPPSLRFALFDVVRQIGGADSEQVLFDSLNSAARGAELAYLARTLEALSPGKYRENAIAAAKNLLAGGKITDVNDRNNLYDILRQFNDTSYTATAQAQLIQSDGTVDRSALRYLQQTLGEKSLGPAAQAFQDGRVKDGDSKEAAGRIGLTYVGAADSQVNDQAMQLFHAAINDPSLSPDQHRNLIEDLNEAGLSNPRNPTPEDLKMAGLRYTLIQAYLQQPYVQNDPVAYRAFQEANKDLTELLQNAGLLK